MILTKKIVFAFYNCFLKIELDCHKEYHVYFKYAQFSKEVVVYALIYSLSKGILEDGFQDSCVLKILLNLHRNIDDGVYC